VTELVFPNCYCDFSSAVSKKLFPVAKVVCFKDILRLLEALIFVAAKELLAAQLMSVTSHLRSKGYSPKYLLNKLEVCFKEKGPCLLFHLH
jgi:hypothetical protein